MNKRNEGKKGPGISRRSFGMGLAFGLGGAALFSGIKGRIKSRLKGPLHEAEFYERIEQENSKEK